MLKARLEQDEVFGRCLAVAEPVQRGDLVLEELPFAQGPKRDSGIVCLACYQFLQFGEDGDSLDRCEICDWPLCAACAIGSDVTDHSGECEVFANARVTFAGNVSDDGVCTQLDCITPLRLVRWGSRGWCGMSEGRTVQILVLAAVAHFSEIACEPAKKRKINLKTSKGSGRRQSTKRLLAHIKRQQ